MVQLLNTTMMGLRAADKIGLFQGVLTTGEGKIAIVARDHGVITNG